MSILVRRNHPGASTSVSGTAKLLVFGNVAFASDATTGERGYLAKFINRTGGASVKGTLVSASTAADKEVIAQANTYDAIAVVQQAGVAEGQRNVVLDGRQRSASLVERQHGGYPR